MTDKEREIAREWFLLTTKPVIYAGNIKEDDLGKDEDTIIFSVMTNNTIAETSRINFIMDKIIGLMAAEN